MSLRRSDDVAVRKSPSVSATAYPAGTKKIGNDGNLWVVVKDSRGVQRWQKYSGYGGEESQPKKKSNLKDVYYDLRGKMGTDLRINEENENLISCDIRYWGNWEHDYEDYERDEEDFEDDDQMILSNDSYNRLKEIIKSLSEKYPDVKINASPSEKNWIDFSITYKPEAVAEKPKVKPMGSYKAEAKPQPQPEPKKEKTKEEFLKGIMASIEGLKLLIEDEPELKPTIEEKVRKRIEGLDYLADEGDDYAAEAAQIMRDFLKESFKFGGNIQKRQKDEEFYENCLRNAQRHSDREYFLHKLNEIDNQKVKFQ